jgi:hypothetical protein
MITAITKIKPHILLTGSNNMFGGITKGGSENR